MKRLWLYLIEMDVIEEEKNRVQTLLNKNSEAYEALYECALKSTQIKNVIKKIIKIPGFRVGSPAYHAKAVEKVYKSLLAGKANNRQWEIYKFSVFELIGNKFNKLLMEADCNGDEDSSAILTKICEQSSDYEVTKSEVVEFYELIPIKRVDEVQSVLNLCKDPDVRDLVNKEIINLTKLLDAKFDGLSQSLANLIDEKILEKEIDPSHLAAFDKKITDSSIDLENKIEGLQNSYDQASTEIKSLVQKLSALEIDLIGTSHDKDIKELAKELDGGLKKINIISRKLNTLKIEIQHETNNSLRDSESKILQECKDLLRANIGTNANSIGNYSDYVSPLVQKNNISTPPDSNITSEEKFVAIFYHKLIDLDETYSFGSACLFHAILKTGNCVIIENDEIVLTWLDTLGWSRNSITMPASPAWHSEKDWRYGANHLFVDTQQIPKILFIYDYDVGLIEGYLLPTLRVWRSSSFKPPLARMYLVPTNAFVEIENERLLESACTLSDSTCHSFKIDNVSLNKKWKKQEDNVVKHHNVEDTGVSADVFSSWSKTDSSSDRLSVCKNYQGLGRALGMNITTAVLNQYYEYKFSLKEFVTPEESHDRAFSVSLGPWVAKNYDELQAEKFEEEIKSLLLL